MQRQQIYPFEILLEAIAIGIDALDRAGWKPGDGCINEGFCAAEMVKITELLNSIKLSPTFEEFKRPLLEKAAERMVENLEPFSFAQSWPIAHDEKSQSDIPSRRRMGRAILDSFLPFERAAGLPRGSIQLEFTGRVGRGDHSFILPFPDKGPPRAKIRINTTQDRKSSRSGIDSMEAFSHERTHQWHSRLLKAFNDGEWAPEGDLRDDMMILKAFYTPGFFAQSKEFGQNYWRSYKGLHSFYFNTVHERQAREDQERMTMMVWNELNPEWQYWGSSGETYEILITPPPAP